MSRDTADILRYAAHLIEQHGWHPQAIQRDEDADSRLGITDALMMAICGEDRLIHTSEVNEAVAYKAARQACLDVVGGGRPMMLSIWNDQPGRTVEEVLAVLRAAADRVGGA